MISSSRLYFQVFEPSVLDAADLLDELLGVSSTKARGSSHGGWYADYSGDDFFYKVWKNAHDTGSGHGIEYHRPEFPDYDVMLWMTSKTDRNFFWLQERLEHPKVKLFLTGFEKNWPGLFWGINYSKHTLGLIK